MANDSVVCGKCKQTIARSGMDSNYYICPICGKYNRIPPRVRIGYLADKDTFCELFGNEISTAPIAFPDYGNKIASAKQKSGENEAVLCGRARIGGYDTCIFVMNSEFMMASMGTVVGDKLAALFEYALLHKLPVVGYTASGGARMQEGVLSLMQMAKVSLAVKNHSDAGLLYLVCLTDPTMGGVTASFATLGDIVIAEPGAQVGFAGKRVIEQNTGAKLPDDFQSAEFQLKSGFADDIVERKNQKDYLAKMLALHSRKGK